MTCVYRVPSLGVVRAGRAPDYLCSVRKKRSGDALRIGVIGHLRFPLSQPFAGGLEAATYALVERLAARGHDVTLFAAPGSVPDLPVRLVTPRQGRGPTVRQLACGDEDGHHQDYLDLVGGLIGSDEFDVIHNNSLHYLPLVLAAAISAPMVTTFHTPPYPSLEAAVALAPSTAAFTSVSEFTARLWRSTTSSTVVSNGVDLDRFPQGAGGGAPVWSGRLVPEKAPHEAIDAARRAGLPLRLAGPIGDEDYYRREIAPRLGNGIDHIGHLDHYALSGLVRSASVCVITPAWDEPFGLVAAEAAASGTPVAAYARGALTDLVTPSTGVLAPAGDTEALAQAMRAAARLDRVGVRAHAEAHLSLDTMVNQYVDLYRALCDQHEQAA